MFLSVLVIAVSVVLFAYWFRYTCVLILSAKTASSCGADAHSLSLNKVGGVLISEQDADLDSLVSLLRLDLEFVTGLSNGVCGNSIDRTIRRIDFWLMRIRYGATRRLPLDPRPAIQEMSVIVAYLTYEAGQLVAVQARE